MFNVNSAPSKPKSERSTLHLWSRLGLVAANLMPILGVLFLGWDLLSVLLLYWLENLMLCGLALLRIFSRFGLAAIGTALTFLLIFIVLAASHMAVIVVLAEALGQAGANAPDVSQAADAPLFSALGMIYQGGLSWILLERPQLLFVALPALLASQVFSHWQGPMLAADQLSTSAVGLARHALSHVIVLHIALLLGTAVIAALRVFDLLPVLVLLVLFKLWFDLRSHQEAERIVCRLAVN